jgi:hypothetical protein
MNDYLALSGAPSVGVISLKHNPSVEWTDRKVASFMTCDKLHGLSSDHILYSASRSLLRRSLRPHCHEYF